MTQNLHDWLTLCAVPSLGPAIFSSLVQQFRTPSEVLRARPERLAKVPYVGKEIARVILESKDSTWSLDQISRA